MQSKWFIRIAVLSIALNIGLSSQAAADTQGAKDAYLKAGQFIQAKDYRSAVNAYQVSLQADPNYFYSYKGLGLAYAYLGDKQQSLNNYDKYLAHAPNDSATKAYADRLRASLGAGAAIQPKPTPQAAAPSTSRGSMNLWAGYTTVNMSAVNNAVNDIGSGYASGGYNSTVTTMGGGIAAGIELLYKLLPVLDLGLGVSYILPLSDASYDVVSPGGFYETKESFTVSLIPIEVGGVVDIPMGNLSIKGAVWAGWGVAAGTDDYSYHNGASGYDDSYSLPMTGGGPIGEIRFGVSYRITDSISLLGQGGYRYCVVPSMSITQDGGSYSSGSSLQYNGSDVAFDFSGLNASGGISFTF